MDMLEQPLEISISREQYLLKEICEFIAAPPPGDVVDIMIKEAYNLADNKHQIFCARHIVYVDTYYRIGMYKSTIGSVCNIPWDMTDNSYTTPAEKRKIMRAVNKYISEVL